MIADVQFRFENFWNLDLICSLHCQVDACLTKLISFNTDMLSKCSKKISIRKEQNLKYAEFMISDIDDIRKFCMSCYRKFTALSKTQKKIK